MIVVYFACVAVALLLFLAIVLFWTVDEDHSCEDPDDDEYLLDDSESDDEDSEHWQVGGSFVAGSTPPVMKPELVQDPDCLVVKREEPSVEEPESSDKTQSKT